MFSHCNESHQTRCNKCHRGEYQPDHSGSEQCLKQKYCDEGQCRRLQLCVTPPTHRNAHFPSLPPAGKGFMQSVENPLAEEPCRCRSDLQCYPVNCEYCEKIPTCAAGYGLETAPGEAQEQNTSINMLGERR